MAATLVSVGMELPQLATDDSPTSRSSSPTRHVVSPVSTTPIVKTLTASEIAAELDAVLAALSADDPRIDAALVDRVARAAIAIAALDSKTDTAELLEIKSKLAACLTILATLEDDAGDVAGLRAALEAALRACVALLQERGVRIGEGVDAHSMVALVEDLENRLEYANGNVWTLRAVKAQANVLISLLADLEAIGAIGSDVADDLDRRLGVALRLCLSLLLEIELGGDGCPETCDPGPCNGCEPEPCEPECPPPPCEPDCVEPTEPTPPTQPPTCESECAPPCGASCEPPCESSCPPPPCENECPPPPCGCPPPPPPPPPCGCPEEDDGALIDVDVDVDVIVVTILGPRGEDPNVGCGCGVEPAPDSVIGRL